MTVLEKRKILHEYIDQANETELEAIYNDYVDGGESGERYEWWKDEELVAEMEKQADALENGTDKGMSLEEVKEHLLNRLKK